MESSFKNPILEDLYLVFDLHNIKNETFGEILEIIKYCSSLVNDDVISIAEEILKRIEEKKFLPSPLNITIIKNLFSLVKRIPDTRELQYSIKYYYSNIVSSPISSPVSPPPIPKKMKKSKDRLNDKVCPC